MLILNKFMEEKKKKLKKYQNVKQIELELKQAKEQIKEYRERYLRALADYQNLEKRIVQEKAQIIKSANKQLILKVLPFLDNLDKAELFIKDSGLKMIKHEFYRILKDENIEEIQVIGKEFDPQFAEVVDMVEGEKDNIVVEVIRKGYMLNGKILRVAQVKVTKKTK